MKFLYGAEGYGEVFADLRGKYGTMITTVRWIRAFRCLQQLNFMVCRRECVCLKARIMDFQEMESRFTECAV
jgi:hypothetical protein